MFVSERLERADSVCVCVCVRERERERKRYTEISTVCVFKKVQVTYI